MERDLELEELRLKCKEYENEVEFLRINIKSLRIELDGIINSKTFKIIRKLKQILWWKK